ncbi:MAG: hypothetical protein RBR30_06580 [Tenuifilaceae bacterium]|nr:hypothetical protein [Tenuifilaceae bacterium]
MKRLILVGIIIQLCIYGYAQYYGDRPLEMTFEQSDFFFAPLYVNPYGTNNFAKPSQLSMDHPLLNLQRNPSNVSNFRVDSLSSNYFYIDFRNSLSVSNGGYSGIYPLLYDYVPRYGYYYSSTRSEVSPLLSLAYLTQLPILNNSISLGATYQIIAQGERYYAIPYDIYRSNAGKTFDGYTYMGTEGYTIEDRFSGSDEMYHEGHSLNLFLSWKPTDALSIGAKAGRFIFDREGSFGSNNLWNQRVDYYSYWKSFENRTQEYDHWDFSLGLTYGGERNSFGMYAGYLTGSANQLMDRDDESLSNSGQEGSTSWSDYSSWYVSDQSWEHIGQNFYGGFQWEREVRSDLSFRLLYNLSSSNQDIALASSIESESENDYYYEYSNWVSESNGYSNMHDFRTGSGTRTKLNHSVSAGFEWQLGEDKKVRFGAIAGVRKQQTETSEDVDAYAESYYYSRYDYESTVNTWERYTRTIEDKTILWEFESRLRSFQIPIFYERSYSDRFTMIFGYNRTMNFWLVESRTLILYDYREREFDGDISIDTNVGERITEPRDRVSSVSNAFMGGLKFNPTQRFGVELILSPVFEKNALANEHYFGMQVWLGVNMNL